MRQAGDALRNAAEHRGTGSKLWLFTVILPSQYMRPNSLCHTPESQKETSISQVSKVNKRGTTCHSHFAKPPASCPGQPDIPWQQDASARRGQTSTGSVPQGLPAVGHTNMQVQGAAVHQQGLHFTEEVYMITPVSQMEK